MAKFNDDNDRFDKHDDKVKGKEGRDYERTYGEIDETGQKPATEDMVVGTGIPADDFVIFTSTDHDVELALKLHHRFGSQADIQPTSIDGDGTANYDAPSGSGPAGSGVRANWNFDFSVNTGIDGSDNTLDDYAFRIVIESGDGERAVFNLRNVAPGVTPWLNSSNQGFSDDDGVNAQLSQNSVNLGFAFMQAIFGSDYNDAGEHYDIYLQAFDNTHLIGEVHQSIDIV